jgi:hypothetical protein
MAVLCLLYNSDTKSQHCVFLAMRATTELDAPIDSTLHDQFEIQERNLGWRSAIVKLPDDYIL